MADIMVVVLGSTMLGTAMAALINQIGESRRQKLKQEHEEETKENRDIQALKAGMKLLLYDRISWMGRKYIAEGQVDFDDRRLLREMHDVYHNSLGGNGDLDNVMNQLDKLPFKE